MDVPPHLDCPSPACVFLLLLLPVWPKMMSRAQQPPIVRAEPTLEWLVFQAWHLFRSLLSQCDELVQEMSQIFVVLDANQDRRNLIIAIEDDSDLDELALT